MKAFKHIKDNQFQINESADLSQVIREYTNLEGPIPSYARNRMVKVLQDFYKHLKKCNTFEELCSFDGMECNIDKGTVEIQVFNNRMMPTSFED